MNLARINRILPILIFILFSSHINSFASSTASLPWRILFLNSYNSGYKWTDEVTEGIHNYFNNRDSFVISTEFIDSKQFQLNEVERWFYPYLENKYSNVEFDLIITSDNDALDFVLKKRSDVLFRNKPIVFCGITNTREYPLEKEDLYGIEETDIFKYSFEKFREIDPEFRTVYFLSDRSVTGEVYKKNAEEVITHYPSYNVVIIDSIQIASFDAFIHNLNGKAIIYYSGISKDGENQYVDHLQIAKRIVDNAQIPVFSPYIADTKGFTGGEYARGQQHARRCAELAEMRLKRIPISKRVHAPELISVFDYMQFKRFNLSMRNLPQNSIIINKPEPIFKKYRLFFIWNGAFLIIMLFIIVSLFWYNRLQKRSKELMKRAMESALESDRLKSSFLANMSHEIRTPMNAIIGFTSLLADENLSSEKRDRYSLIIKDRAYDLIRFIDDLLDVSRLEVGQLSLYEAEIDLNEFLNNLYDYYVIKISNDVVKSKLYFRLNVSEELNGVRFITDKHRLKQVLTNLIENALKFTNTGGIDVICQKKSNTELQFIVRDTGIGIPKDKYEIVFQHFRQAHNQLSTKLGGTGLGLTISKGIIRLMKGEIWLESEIGKGSSFLFSIPFTNRMLTTDSKPEN